MNDRERFDEKWIPEPYSGCWLWTASCQRYGYGQIKDNKLHRPIVAHRMAWQLYIGDIPDGQFVLHHCDTPSCVNPAHLFLGTKLDNTADMISKGRESFLSTAKLTKKDVVDIRSDTRLQREVAEDYGVDQSLISYIKSRKIWKHL